MTNIRILTSPTTYQTRRGMLALALVVAGTNPAASADVAPEADAVLRAMSEYLSGLTSFRVASEASTEILLRDGRKIQLTATGYVRLDRELGFKAERQGPVCATRLFYDGAHISIFSEKYQSFIKIPADGGIGAALDEVRAVFGSEAVGGADLLYPNAYEGLMFDVESGDHLGDAWVGGELTHHLSYRAVDIDWQLWVLKGDKPIPVKYVITSKWMTAAPQFSAQFSQFEATVETTAADFEFVPEADANEITIDDLAGLDLLTEE